MKGNNQISTRKLSRDSSWTRKPFLRLAGAVSLGEDANHIAKRVNYRRLAFEQYDPVCAHCGFGMEAVLEVAHIDGNRSNNDAKNLVILARTSQDARPRHNLDETIVVMRDPQE